MAKPTLTSNELSPNGNVANSLKEFQLSGNKTEKTKKEFGEKIVLQVEQIINSGYFNDRNRRFAENRAMAAGRMNVTKFMDFFNINGKTNYVNLSWKSIMIVNTIIARLVGRWMTKREKASVEAKDPISIKYKKEAYDEAEFLLYNKEMLAELQAESGVQVIPQDAFVPDDKDDLDLWAKEELRTPEEILYEQGLNTVFDENGWGDMGVNTRKVKHDAAEVGLIGCETVTDKYGKIHVNYCKPENIFYSESHYDDFRDSDIKGEIVSYKISQIRDMYPDLTVAELYEIAKITKQWTGGDKITFNTGWNTNMFLPFDDWNVDVVRFTLRSLDTDRTLIKKGKDGSTYVDKPKKRIDNVFPGNEYLEKTQWNIYRGVYVRQSKFILEWGLEKNMIRPQKYEKIAEAKSPYSFYMYQNANMRNLAVPEKIEEPVEQMILARLKIQQLVANLRPSGYQYDIDGLQEVDLGNGIMKPLELKKVTDQTGDVYYRSRNAEGERIDTPIRELPNTGGVAQLSALIEIYNYHFQVLRDEIGSNEFAEGQTIKPRTGVQNVQTSMEVSFNATDYMNDACRSMKDMAADSIACLLHDAINFQSKEYRNIMKESDIRDREFSTRITMLPTAEEITTLENTVNMAIQANPVLSMYLNPEKIKRIARENVKLGELYLRAGQRRAIKGEEEKAIRMQEMNGKVQQESAMAAEQAKQQGVQMEIRMKSEVELALSAAKQKEIILTGIFGIYQKGAPMPPELKLLSNEIIQNVGLPLFAENVMQEQELKQGMAQQEEQQVMEQEGQMQQQVPQEQMI